MLDQSPVGSAFTRPPIIPQPPAADQAQPAATESVAPSQSQPQPQPTPEMTVLAPPPPRMKQGILPQPAAQSQQATVASSPAVTETTPAEPIVPLAPQETSGTVDKAAADYAMWQQQMAQERQAFAQREQQWAAAYEQQAKQLTELQQAQAELARYKQQEAIAQKYADDKAFEGMESVDPNDARRIAQITADMLYAPLAEERAKMELERRQMQDQLAQTQTYAQQQAIAAQAVRVRDQLLAAHPDFFELYNYDPKFRQYLNSREGKSSYTREQLAMAEYNAGNAAYIIDLIDKFKGVQPKTQDIQTVAPVQVASAAPVAPQQPASVRPLSELIRLMHTGQLTQDQYRMELNKLRAAQPQPA